jgi:two-component system sensor histidine kinase ArlS
VSAKQTGNDIVITIADTGSGIDEAFREKIFEPFFRVDKSRSREIGGVGLGLAMVREIVRAHDGKIDVHKNAYGGTTFEVKLGFSASLELSTPSSE